MISQVGGDYRNWRKLSPSGVRWLFVHHCSLSMYGTDNPEPITDDELTGENLCATFQRMDKPPPLGLGTGGSRPYHALIQRSGLIDQCLPLSVGGAHAKGYNPSSLAVATAGEAPINMAQMGSLVGVLVDWKVWTWGGPGIVGHTSMPGASGPGHPRCPHPALSIADVAEMVARNIPEGAMLWNEVGRAEYMEARGWVIAAP